MDELILATLRGDASSAELRRLDDWRAADPANERRFRELERLWSARRLLAGRLRAATPPTADALLSRRGADGPSRRWRGWWLVAAAATTLLLLTPYVSRRGREAPEAPLRVVTAANEQSTVRLQDGTVVRLAPESHLTYRQIAERREAWLGGHGYFSVAKGAKPFRLKTPAGEIVVHGTRFDVVATQQELSVVVAEGLVTVRGQDREVELTTGHGTVTGPGRPPEPVVVPDVYGALEWLGSFVAFEGTPLRTVAEELERRFGIAVEIRSPELGERTVTSWSTERGPQEIMAAVCAAVDATCLVSDTLITVDP